MKKSLKVFLGIGLLAVGTLTFTGCTQSFCTNADTSHILYRYDYGVTQYYDATDADKPADAEKLWADNDNIYYAVSLDKAPQGFTNIVTNARNNNIEVPYSLEYWSRFDSKVLEQALSKAGKSHSEITTVDQLTSNDPENPGVLSRYGAVKFYDDAITEDKGTWNNWELIHKDVVKEMSDDGLVSIIPTADFVNYYKSQMNTYVGSFRACYANNDGFYGNYGYGDDKGLVYITAKDWGFAWSKGLFEGLLVYPISWLIDILTTSMTSALGAGAAAILAIVIVTLIVRGIMLIFTFKQSSDTAKMNELQPQIQKIQNKYPNADTNKYEKQRMSEEMSKLYKKNGVHPFRSIITLIIQFPIFICVWGAMQGSACLATGSFLGLNLNSSIREVLFDGANWTAGNMGGLTALILFILMSLTQAAAMLLPQFIQKFKAKKAAKLGKNPAAKSQNNKMKWFTYIMLIMIIIMGFSLVSAMGVYWLIGAVISIIQTIVTQVIQSSKSKKRKN